MIKHVSYGHKWYIVIFIRIFPIYFSKTFLRPLIVRSTLKSKYFLSHCFGPPAQVASTCLCPWAALASADVPPLCPLIISSVTLVELVAI